MAGIVLLALIFVVKSDWRWLGLLGVVMLGTASLNFCPIYKLLGISTVKAKRINIRWVSPMRREHRKRPTRGLAGVCSSNYHQGSNISFPITMSISLRIRQKDTCFCGK